MTFTPDQLRSLGYDPSQPGSVLQKSTRKAITASPDAHSRHFDGSGDIKTPKKRLRQSGKPLMNKLEAEFAAWIRRSVGVLHVYEQAITFRLCNGVKFTPDVVAVIVCSGRWRCYDVKGKQPIQDDASVKIKVAAQQFQNCDWYIVWKDKHGQWQEQNVLS